MKPLRLEMQAFGPYVEKQVIDFERLSESGIFLIKGNTGSGKTTIFDAMTFALYGGSSGEAETVKNGRNDLEEWRCTQADRTLATEVSFSFRVRERAYVFTRRLIPKRKNLEMKLEAGELKDGSVIPFFNNPKLNDLKAKAQELIGLNKEQFRQVILLPQGQFERFLTASSAEKEEILKKIFDAQRWGRYAEAFYQAADARKKQLDGIRTGILQSLAEENMAALPELEEKLRGLQDKKKALEDEHLLFDSEGKQAALENDRKLVSEIFRPLHENEAERERLNSLEKDIGEKRARLQAALQAEELRDTVERYEAASVERDNRRKAEENCRRLFPALQAARNEAREAVDAHEKNSPTAELNRKIGALELKKGPYGRIGAAKTAYETANAALKTAAAAQAVAAGKYEKALADAREAYEGMTAAARKAAEYRDRYYRNIYGELAADLKEGEACPICGSVHHPSPAERHPDSVSREALDLQEKAAETAGKKWEAADRERTAWEEDKRRLEEALRRKEKELNAAESALRHAEAEMVEGIPDLAALTGRIRELQMRIQTFENEGTRRKEAAQKAERELTEAAGRLQSAEKESERAESEHAAAEERLQKALAEKGYHDYREIKAQLLTAGERSLLQKTVTAHETDCRRVAESIRRGLEKAKGTAEPDASRFAARQSEISEEMKRFSASSSELSQEIRRLAAKQDGLLAKQAVYDSGIRQAEDDFSFARKLRGDTGVGLQRYVLAVMFNQVIAEANRMLEKVHGGRYRLFRSDERGQGNKKGLELKVRDSRSPESEGRHVSMLSGGEKFLVSLALSIGLSAVAQSAGIRIEALFIDEGFGTLDERSIRDAMDVLDSVRKSSGMIGIISHVQLLEANIPTHVEVVKTEKGSYIKT